MRRIYVRQTEYEVIDSTYMPNLPNDEIYLLPHGEAEMSKRPFWLKVVLLAALIVAVMSFASGGGHAQSNVRQFYGWSDYGGNKPPVINVYPQNNTVTILPVPIQPYQTPPRNDYRSFSPSELPGLKIEQNDCVSGPQIGPRCSPN